MRLYKEPASYRMLDIVSNGNYVPKDAISQQPLSRDLWLDEHSLH